MEFEDLGEHGGRTFGQKILFGLAIFGIAIGVLLVLTLGFIGYNLSELSLNPFDLKGLASSNGRTNILVLGVGDPGHAGKDLSDTLMVISIDNANHQVAMISIPRDLRVDIPGYRAGKINTANALGGPKLAEQVVANTLGIPINYYISTDFSGLKQIVDSVGGIDVTVKERLYDAQYPCEGDKGVCGIDIKPGNYHMDGTTVLQYTRCRKGTCGNDFGRASRQQEVIGLLEEKIAQPGVYLNPTRLAPLLTSIRTYAKTDLSPNQLARAMLAMKNANRKVNFVYSTAPGGLLVNSGGSDLVPVGGKLSDIQNLAQNIFTVQLPKPEDE